VLQDVAMIRTRIQENIEAVLERPAMWGTSDAVEGIFLTLLELLHSIDHPDCKERCAWNAHVNHSTAKYQRSCTIAGCLQLDHPDEPEPDHLILGMLQVDLKQIWSKFLETHPVKFDPY
jgi:hypothetical protein